MGRFYKLFLIHEDEGSEVFYFLTFFIIVSAGMAIGRSTADALFLKRLGVEYLPVMYLIQSLFLATVSIVYAAFADRVPAESFFKVLFTSLIVLVFTAWLMISFTATSLVYPFYYLVYEVASELLLVHAALYMQQNMNTLQTKRLSPLIFSGVQVGTIIGGVSLALLSPIIGPQNLLLAWCLFLAVGIAIISMRHIKTGASRHFRAPKKGKNLLQDCITDVKKGVKFTYTSELLRAASFALFFMVISFYILCYSVNRIYTQTFESEEALTSFFGALTAATSTTALLMQLFITNRAIQRFGVRKINLLFPITTLVSLLTLISSFTLPAALAGSMNKDALMPAFRNPVRSMFFNILPDYIQGRVRAMSVAVVLPLALMTCGCILLLMQRADNPSFFLVPGVITSLLYILFSRKMNKAYVSTLISTLKERLFLPEDRMYTDLQGSDKEVLKEVLKGVNHKDDAVAVVFAKLLVKSFPDMATDAILNRMGHADTAAKDKLLRMLEALDLSLYKEQLHQLVDSGDAHLRATAMQLLADQGDEWMLSMANELMNNDNPRLQVVGIRVALHDGGQENGAALESWKRLLAGEPHARLAALDLIPVLERVSPDERDRMISGYRKAITSLLGNPENSIRIRSLKGLRYWRHGGDENIESAISGSLASVDPDLREAAASCLHLLPGPAGNRLTIEALGDGSPKVRLAAIESLKAAFPDYRSIALEWIENSHGSPRAQQALLESLRQLELTNSEYEKIADAKSEEAWRLQNAINVLDSNEHLEEKSSGLVLLRYTLKERLDQTVQLALYALEPLHEPGMISTIRAGFSSGDTRHAANACEVLCNLDNRPVAMRLNKILVQITSKAPQENTEAAFVGLKDVLNWCINHQDSWLNQCATHAMHSLEGDYSHA